MERSQALATEPITAIIPAYNEERTLGRVLSVVTQVEQIHQIIVVDDGSTDDTAAVAQTWQAQDNRVILQQMRCNGGKGGAMFAGARMAQNDLLLFLDADLLGLRPQAPVVPPVNLIACVASSGWSNTGCAAPAWRSSNVAMLALPSSPASAPVWMRAPVAPSISAA